MSLDRCYSLYEKAINDELDDDNLRDSLFSAYVESPVYCMKTLLYIRGQKSIHGRRVLFMKSFELIHYLLVRDSSYWLNLVKYIPLVGRWDDLLYSWLNSDSYKFKSIVGKYIKLTYFEDLKEVNRGWLPKTLLAKWMPSYVSSNTDKSRLSKALAKNLKLSKSEYTSNLNLLRNKVDSIIDVYSKELIIDELERFDSSNELRSALDRYFKHEGK